MRRFRWLPDLCLTLATVALIGLPPAQAIAEALDAAADQPVSPTANSLSGAALDTSDVPDTQTPEIIQATEDDAVAVTSQITSTAQSGTASVIDNQQAGDATSGQATATSTILATVNTATTLDDSAAALFSIQIAGDTTGNIVLDDRLLGQPGQAGTAVVALDGQTDRHIINDLTVAAQSGDAIIASNVLAGNAATGDVQAAATVVTIINSVIGAEHSFLGVITINGSLIGDILLPARFADNTLLPTMAPTDISQNLQIDNQVTVAAQSGHATVADNQSAGSAATGSATTLVSQYNLINASFAAKSWLWVFVNVLGEWDGTLLGEPSLTAGLFLAGTDAPDTTTDSGMAAVTVSVENNISVTAQSGNAVVEHNVTAGGASTGNAKALVTMLNIVNSTVVSSDWFGILFINVFGSWHGNLNMLPEPATTPVSEPTVPPAVASMTTSRRVRAKDPWQPTAPAGNLQPPAAVTQAASSTTLPDSPTAEGRAEASTTPDWLGLLAATVAGMAIVFVLLRREKGSRS